MIDKYGCKQALLEQPPALRGADGQHCLAHDLPRGLRLEDVGRLLQREFVRRPRVEGALFVLAQRLGGHGAHGLGLPPDVSTPVGTHYRAVPYQDAPGWRIGDAAAREAYDEDLSLPGDATQGGVEDVAPHGVEDDVRASSLCDLKDTVANVFFAVVDQVIGAALRRGAEAFRTSACGYKTAAPRILPTSTAARPTLPAAPCANNV